MKGRELVRDYGLPTLPGSVPTHHWTKIGISSLLHLRIPFPRTDDNHHTFSFSLNSGTLRTHSKKYWQASCSDSKIRRLVFCPLSK
jgi:hypothetical protein